MKFYKRASRLAPGDVISWNPASSAEVLEALCTEKEITLQLDRGGSVKMNLHRIVCIENQ
jgi:hypothetical protein